MIDTDAAFSKLIEQFKLVDDDYLTPVIITDHAGMIVLKRWGLWSIRLEPGQPLTAALLVFDPYDDTDFWQSTAAREEWSDDYINQKMRSRGGRCFEGLREALAWIRSTEPQR